MAKFRLPYAAGNVWMNSRYGTRTLNGVQEFHKGVDLVGTEKTIIAPCDGYIGWAGSINDKPSGGLTWQWGNYVRLETSDGYMIYLCHMASVAVKAGQRVNAGDKLGMEGSTGYSTGSHCHFEVRYAGKSIDPTPFLGISNVAGCYPVAKYNASQIPDIYKVGGLTFYRVKNPRLVYLDAKKSTMAGKNCCNANFFGNYKRGKVEYTLPRGVLVCDMGKYKIPSEVGQDIAHFISGGKLVYNCADNAADSEFRGKKVSTLIIPETGKPYVDDVIEVPANTKYAVSGVPVLRNGNDVDFYNYVVRQGWGADCVRNTYHNWLGVRNGEIWLITGKSAAKSGNMIYGMWFWDLVKDEGFEDVIKLDGGGSYYCRVGGKALSGSSGLRRINAYFCWD
jgi:hypothetical protein